MEISKDKKKFEEIFLVILLAFPFVQIFELNNYRLFYNLFIFSGFIISILILLILHRLELKYQGKFVNIKLYYIASLISIFLDKYLGLFFLFKGNIGLELKFLEFKYFLNYFLSFVLLIILTIFIFRFLKLMQNNKLILIYIISLFIFFNLIINFFYNFQYQTLDNYSLSLQKKKQAIFNNSQKKIIILYLDELIGPGQIDTKIKNGQLAKNIYQNFFLDFNFLSFNNAFSIYKNTNNAISSTMAFNSSSIYNQNYHESIFDKFTKWKITKNDFFAQNKDKKILSIKNKALNYCDKNVETCLRLNSENQNSPGINNFFYKDVEYLTYNLSKNNSIIGNFILRISRFFGYRKINTFSLDKIFFKKNLEKLTSVINNTNFDIYFFHFLVPHSPFGFDFKNKDQECSYIHFDKKINNANEILEQHYKEIACTISLLKNFMQSINNLDNTTFLLISDTGFPVKGDLKSSHQVLYAIQNLKENVYDQNIQISSQKLFSMHFNKKHKDLHLSEKNYYFDREEKKYKLY